MNVISGCVFSPLMSARSLVLLSGRLPYLKTIEQVSHEKKAMGIRGQRKLFITSQAKLDPEHYSINARVANNLPLLITFSISYTIMYVICLTGLKITLLLCLIFRFLYNRIPCKYNVWAVYNFILIDMIYLSIWLNTMHIQTCVKSAITNSYYV